MEKTPMLPVYDATPEGEADRLMPVMMFFVIDMTLHPKVRLIDVLIRAVARIMIADMVLMVIDLSVVVVYRVAESGLIGEVCGAEVDIGLMESRLNLI